MAASLLCLLATAGLFENSYFQAARVVFNPLQLHGVLLWNTEKRGMGSSAILDQAGRKSTNELIYSHPRN